MRAFPGSASRIHGYLARHRRIKYISPEAFLPSSYFFSKKPSLLSANQLLLLKLISRVEFRLTKRMNRYFSIPLESLERPELLRIQRSPSLPNFNIRSNKCD